MNKEFLLEQELPDFDEALRRAKASLGTSCSSKQQPCPHLDKYLPAGFLKPNNPVHALHLESQLDGSPVFYGEEHERWLAVTTAGFPVSWHSMVKVRDETPISAARTTIPNSATSTAMGGMPSKVSKLPAVADSAVSGMLNAAPTAVSSSSTSTTSSTLPTATENNDGSINMVPSHTAASVSEVADATKAANEATARAQNEAKFISLVTAEDHIRSLRRDFLSKRITKKDKKRKIPSLQSAAAWRGQPDEMASEPRDEQQWKHEQQEASEKAKVWMEYFRQSRTCFWTEQKNPFPNNSTSGKLRSDLTPNSVFGALSSATQNRLCQLCQSNPMESAWFCQPTKSDATGDELLQCLDCSMTACSASHGIQHYLQTNHAFAVSCGRQAQVYCFKCGDFVYHPVFQQEKERLDLAEKIPGQAWKAHPVQRSFDALQFLHVPDQGIFWRGMKATYPPLVPREHVHAARLCRQRQIVFGGDTEELSLTASRQAVEFTAAQQLASPADRWKISAPVGMYNLGNTCFMSAILQCLIHCVPVQRYFLRDVGHNHEACAIYRKMYCTKPKEGSGGSAKSNKGSDNVCLACEMDKLFLRYVSSTKALDVLSAVSLPSERSAGIRSNDKSISSQECQIKGDPLITADMLSAAWKCGGMDHLAGYEQRDAHEFLHGFLEILGKHTKLHRTRLYNAINSARRENTIKSIDEKRQDEIKNLFEGTLRSVLVCRDCGSKRIQTENFMSISLPLSKEVKLETADVGASPRTREKLTVERCLKHFTMPEILADDVECPSCGKKTPTKKQHVVSKLPRVLCLHLKRFDAAQNRKIEDFVSFPSKGLNMGRYLPHWCEVSRVQSVDNVSPKVEPMIAFDLFATVNHFGNLQSGHYVSNLKVKNRWYHCNDSHVGFAGVGSGEEAVLRSGGAYLLFYVRR